MAKTYIDIVKYMVEARFEISGLVDKPDIIGAVFGQTEGLLGSDLDLRELQKNGKIGRIEISTQNAGGRTIGKLFLPSSLGKVETCILAAAVESVDRVGPFETTFKIEKVEDTRNEKRKKIVTRAKELVKLMITTGLPDSRELSDMVEVEVKSSAVTSYGSDQLPSGPDIDTSEEVMLVEGRADVINLLKSDITNCIAVGGAAGTIPKTIIDLCNAKETTIFLDGDRGGDMILKGIMNAAEVDFVARAPDGKEVEELTRKEIIKALRSRVPIEQLFPNLKKGDKARQERGVEVPRQDSPRGQQPSFSRFQHGGFQQARPPAQAPKEEERRPQMQPAGRPAAGPVLSPSDIASNLSGRSRREAEGQQPALNIDSDVRDVSEPAAAGAGAAGPSQKFVASLDELHNTLRGRLYRDSGEMIAEIPIRELIQAVQDTKGINAVVFDGIITQRLIELAYKAGVKQIYGIRQNQVSRTYEGMLLYTKEH